MIENMEYGIENLMGGTPRYDVKIKSAAMLRLKLTDDPKAEWLTEMVPDSKGGYEAAFGDVLGIRFNHALQVEWAATRDRRQVPITDDDLEIYKSPPPLRPLT